MAEPKRGIARIEVPRRNAASGPAGVPAAGGAGSPGPSTRQRLMAQVEGNRQDPWVAPLAGLLLAFSVVSLIIQLLIAFS
ncbi:MAG TPA: hypothetical protein VGD78_13600 [Chthoniobacterales bacterium]